VCGWREQEASRRKCANLGMRTSARSINLHAANTNCNSACAGVRPNRARLLLSDDDDEEDEDEEEGEDWISMRCVQAF
jgi:hypothetical protein